MGWDQQLAAELVPDWITRGLISGSLIAIEELIAVVDALLRSGTSLSVPSVTVAPRRPLEEQA